MKRFSTLSILLLLVGIQASSQSLIQYPYNPDEDNNQNIGSPDLLGFLSYYGEPFTPEPILLDSVDLFTVIQNMNATINNLQQTVTNLQEQINTLSTATTSNSGLYKVVVNVTGGAINSITGLYDPSGVNINGEGGWSVAANTPSANAIQITHPTGVPLTGLYSLGVNGGNVLTRPITDRLGYGTTNYTCFQNSSFTTATIYAATPNNAGYASASTGDFFIVYFQVGQ